MEAAHAARGVGPSRVVDTSGTRRGLGVTMPATAARQSRPATERSAHDAHWGQDKARVASLASPTMLFERSALSCMLQMSSAGNENMLQQVRSFYTGALSL